MNLRFFLIVSFSSSFIVLSIRCRRFIYLSISFSLIFLSDCFNLGHFCGYFSNCIAFFDRQSYLRFYNSPVSLSDFTNRFFFGFSTFYTSREDSRLYKNFLFFISRCCMDFLRLQSLYDLYDQIDECTQNHHYAYQQDESKYDSAEPCLRQFFYGHMTCFLLLQKLLIFIDHIQVDSYLKQLSKPRPDDEKQIESYSSQPSLQKIRNIEQKDQTAYKQKYE